MKTIIIDIINKKAIKLLQDLALLQLIRLFKEKTPPEATILNWPSKYKGAMTKQSLSDTDSQLNELRNAWG